MSELGLTSHQQRGHRDETSVYSLTQETGEAGDRSCDRWIGGQVLEAALSVVEIVSSRAALTPEIITAKKLKSSRVPAT